MCEQGFGRLITIASGAGTVGLRIGVSPYAAGKGGAIGFMRHLAVENARSGVTANSLALGLMNVQGPPSEVTQALAAQIPVGRLGTPDDIAALCAYLASARGVVDDRPDDPHQRRLGHELMRQRAGEAAMAETCRAAVFLGDGRYEVREFPVPDPPPGGAVLAVEAVGLCGSDVAQFHGVQLVPGASAFPVVPGHETVGRRRRSWRPTPTSASREGDRVAVDEVLSTDPYRIYGYSDMTGDGEVGLWGGYGEDMQIFAGTRLHRMTDRRPAEEVTLFEPLANALHWVDVVGVQRGRHGRDPGPRPPGPGGARGGAGPTAGPGDPHRRGGRRPAPRRRPRRSAPTT